MCIKRSLPHGVRRGNGPEAVVDELGVSLHALMGLCGANKRKKGECYFCLEKFSLDHKCASKGVFLMELEETDGPEAVVDELGVSLHALTGLCGANTMQLMIHIDDKQLQALVDSSSTHSLVHEAVVHALGLDVVHRPGLSVKVANGE
jgi:DNA-directed RNA polymerase subunit N (RpoN/RPB10)